MRISTAEAAKLLGMSKPYLILLMREKEIEANQPLFRMWLPH